MILEVYCKYVELVEIEDNDVQRNWLIVIENAAKFMAQNWDIFFTIYKFILLLD
jgi:hypothetical protein